MLGPREDLDAGGDLSCVQEAEHREDEEGTGEHEGRDASPQGDLPEDREGVGLEEQAPQGGALEGHLLESRQLLLVGSARAAVEIVAYAVVGHLAQVHGDEVIGPDLGLRSRQELLAGVLPP